MEFILIDRMNKDIKQEKKSITPIENKINKSFFCDRCNSTFFKQRDYDRHMNRKTPCRKNEIKIENKIDLSSFNIDPNVGVYSELFSASAKQDLPKFNLDALTKVELEGGFAGIISASRRSGKTNFIKYIYDELDKQFDIIILFSDTLHNQKYSFAKDPKFNKFNTSILEDVFQFQKNTDNAFKILIIMDDCVSNETKADNSIMQLYLTGRNWNISCIISTQISTLVNKKIRGNTDFVFIGKTNTPENRLNLIETFLVTCVQAPTEVKTKVAKLEYLDKYIVENTEDYNFLVLDYLNDGERVYNFKAPKVL